MSGRATTPLRPFAVSRTKTSHIKRRDQFDCDSCRYQFSVTAGTIFHDSHLPLKKWFAAVYLMCESRKGISANQLKRILKVAYKTAWYLCHRIRAAVKDADEPLEGTVELMRPSSVGVSRVKSAATLPFVLEQKSLYSESARVAGKLAV